MLEDMEALKLIFSRIKWEYHKEDRMLRIATSSDLDCIFEMVDLGKLDQTENSCRKRSFDLLLCKQ